MQKERLQWDVVTPSGDIPFTNAGDYTILYNDWPYALDPQIKHLVVWTKFLLAEDETSGDLTLEAREMVDSFVSTTFCGKDGVSREQLVWFKNWKSLKSVHALGEIRGRRIDVCDWKRLTNSQSIFTL